MYHLDIMPLHQRENPCCGSSYRITLSHQSAVFTGFPQPYSVCASLDRGISAHHVPCPYLTSYVEEFQDWYSTNRMHKSCFFPAPFWRIFQVDFSSNINSTSSFYLGFQQMSAVLSLQLSDKLSKTAALRICPLTFCCRAYEPEDSTPAWHAPPFGGQRLQNISVNRIIACKWLSLKVIFSKDHNEF